MIPHTKHVWFLSWTGFANNGRPIKAGPWRLKFHFLCDVVGCRETLSQDSQFLIERPA